MCGTCDLQERATICRIAYQPIIRYNEQKLETVILLMLADDLEIDC